MGRGWGSRYDKKAIREQTGTLKRDHDIPNPETFQRAAGWKSDIDERKKVQNPAYQGKAWRAGGRCESHLQK